MAQLVPLPEVERLSASVIRILGGNPGKVRYCDSIPFGQQVGLTSTYSLPCKVCVSIQTRTSHSHLSVTGTNTYLIGRGHQRILIDTGEGRPTWAERLQSVLSEEKATVHQALLTHWHGDHVKGVDDLLRICPQATVFKHRPDTGHQDIHDGQVFSVEGATLTACHTPGHTVDHMTFVLEEEDAIFTGDSKYRKYLSTFRSRVIY